MSEHITLPRATVEQALEFLENGNFVYPTQLADNLRDALAQQPEPVQEPDPTYKRIGCVQHDCEECQRRTQRKPLSEEEKRALADKFLFCQPESYEVSGVFDLISAVERKVRGE